MIVVIEAFRMNGMFIQTFATSPNTYGLGYGSVYDATTSINAIFTISVFLFG